MDQILGEIRIFGGTFAPQGWAACNGQLLSVSQNTALYSLLGTTYGGDGQTTFALPDLRSRVPVGMGQGTGLANYQEGQVGGSETVSLSANQLPAHQHSFSLQANTGQATASSPAGAIFAAANDGQTDPVFPYTQNAADTTMAVQSTGVTGGSQAVPVIQPYIALNYIIATTGVYPSRP